MTVIASSTNAADLSMTLVAEFAADPERVWELWRDPRKLERWYGPAPYPATFTRYEFEPGGQCRYSMTGPGDFKHYGWWRIDALDAPRRIEFVNGLAGDDGEPVPGVEPIGGVVTFEPIATGTRMTILAVFADADQMEQLATGMQEGMSLAIGQIDALLDLASLVLKMSVSLDGFVAPTDGSTDWVAAGRSEDGAGWTVETLSNAGAHLIGATTYAGWATYWPGASGPFAKAMNEIPKVVFSNSLTSADWDETEIAAGDLAAAITRLKHERSGGYLLAQGGVRFARSLVETGLIDEYRLVIHPVVLGAGERIFSAPLTLEPISTTAFSGGAVAHVFAAHA